MNFRQDLGGGRGLAQMLVGPLAAEELVQHSTGGVDVGPWTDLVDPAGRLPSVWFQQMDEPRPQRSRMHVDLWIPTDELHERLQSAITAGGQLLTDEYAPAFWVLADAEGNEVCLCTWQDQNY